MALLTDRTSRFTTFSRLRIAAVMGLALVGALTAGGCNNELKDENAKLKAEVEQVKSENQSLSQNNQALQSSNQQLQATVDSLKAQPPITRDPLPPTRGGPSNRGGGETITVAGDVAFGSGQAVLTAAGKKELDGIAAKIKRQYASNSIRIEGYTDSDPIKKSKWGSNEALSQARAQAVEKYLQSKGLKNPMDAVGMGAANPKATKKDSRRVEIKIQG